MKKLITLLIFLIGFSATAEAQFPFGFKGAVRYLYMLSEIGKSGDTDSLIIYKPFRFAAGGEFDSVPTGISADSAWNAVTLGNDAEDASGQLNFIMSDNDQFEITGTTDDQMVFINASGGYGFGVATPPTNLAGLMIASANPVLYLYDNSGATSNKEVFAFNFNTTALKIQTLSFSGSGTVGNTVSMHTFDNAGAIVFNEAGADANFRLETAGEDSALVVDGADGDVYMEGLGSGVGDVLVRVDGTDEIVELNGAVTFPSSVTVSGGPVVSTFEGWCTHEAATDTITLGTLPTNAIIIGLYVWVQEAFDSDGNDFLEVGYDADPNAYGTSLDVSSTGVKNMTLGATSKTVDATSRVVKVFYDDAGDDSPTGEVHVVVEWIQATVNP